MTGTGDGAGSPETLLVEALGVLLGGLGAAGPVAAGPGAAGSGAAGSGAADGHRHTADGAGPDAADGAADPSVCAICPVCRLLAALRRLRPEVVEHLAAAGEELLAAALAFSAGPRDAGPEDAGPEDAGPEDAGPRDAGPRDAGPRDAEVPTGTHQAPARAVRPVERIELDD